MNDKLESILNELIETSKDGENGFTKAAGDARSAELKSMFTEGARRCREGARELQDHVRAAGGDPEKTGSVAAAIHRGWLSVKEAVVGREDKAILEEVERGEDYAKAAYKKALEHDLPAPLRAIVERQYRGVIENHDRVRALRDRFRASAQNDSGEWNRQQAASAPDTRTNKGQMVGENWPRSSQVDD